MYNLDDFRAASPEETDQMLDEIVQEAQQEGGNPLEDEIAAYEEEYGMSSEEMKEKLARGEIEETQEISEWVHLINAISY